MAKGGEFERELCKEISRWWSRGSRDDLFWRTSNSGGRATVRAKKGQRTAGHAGDITATSSAGRKLTDRITFEMKRGYNTAASLHTLFDLRPRNDASAMYETWIQQARAAAGKAGTPYWCIIHRRDGRVATMTMPYDLWKRVRGDVEPPDLTLYVDMFVGPRRGPLKQKPHRTVKRRWVRLVTILLSDWFDHVPPDAVASLKLE